MASLCAQVAQALVWELECLEPQPGDSCGLGDSASALQQTCLSRPEHNRLKGRDGGLVSVAFSSGGRVIASGPAD